MKVSVSNLIIYVVKKVKENYVEYESLNEITIYVSIKIIFYE